MELAFAFLYCVLCVFCAVNHAERGREHGRKGSETAFHAECYIITVGRRCVCGMRTNSIIVEAYHMHIKP